MKKFFTLLIGFLLIFTMLSSILGCSKSKPQATNDGQIEDDIKNNSSDSTEEKNTEENNEEPEPEESTEDGVQ